MSVFDDFLDALRADLAALAEEQLRDFRDEILRDGRDFAGSIREDLERWMGLVRDGLLTPDDFAWLVEGKRDVAEMEALRAAGLAQARVDRLRSALLDTVVGAALRVV